ncbi:uncharacterized protein METZ01_LOCUS482912 [marine metagenome]|uniref:Uncharacterized protein n=1 Tax=marine metagenome TaxID=408172 RepID=A0A383CEP3_9ZZZZ
MGIRKLIEAIAKFTCEMCGEKVNRLVFSQYLMQ